MRLGMLPLLVVVRALVVLGDVPPWPLPRLPGARYDTDRVGRSLPVVAMNVARGGTLVDQAPAAVRQVVSVVEEFPRPALEELKLDVLAAGTGAVRGG